MMKTITKDSIEYIAKIADGSMRQALTLLDKCSSYSTDLNINNVLAALVENPCPIEALIKKDYDETGNEVYYKTKKQTCNIPENASESMWDFSNPAKAKEFT